MVYVDSSLFGWVGLAGVFVGFALRDYWWRSKSKGEWRWWK